MITKKTMGGLLHTLSRQRNVTKFTIAEETGLSVYTVRRVLCGSESPGWLAYLMIGLYLGYLPTEYKTLLALPYHSRHKSTMKAKFISLLQRYKQTAPREVLEEAPFRPVWLDVLTYATFLLALVCVVMLVITFVR